MTTDINQTYSGDHFAIYTNIRSLCYIPETKKEKYRWLINRTKQKGYTIGPSNSTSTN